MFLRKVEINKSTFYLAGSIHEAKEADFPLFDLYVKAYENAEMLFLK